MPIGKSQKPSTSKSTKIPPTAKLASESKVKSSDGSSSYSVKEFANGEYTCTCPAFERFPGDCKHIKSVKGGSKAPNNLKLKQVPVGKDGGPAVTGKTGGIAGIFSNRVAAPVPGASKSKRKEKPLMALPTELSIANEVFVATKMIEKAIGNKGKSAAGMVVDHCLRTFADQWAVSGVRPATANYMGGRGNFDFIQTKRIYLKPERVQALRDMGIDIDSWVTLKGVNINFEAIQSLGLEDKLQKALGALGVTGEQLEQIFQPKHELKEGFFDGMKQVVEESLGDEEDISEKMYNVLKALEPVKQTKNHDLDIEGETTEERLKNALELVMEAPLEVDSGESYEESDDE